MVIVIGVVAVVALALSMWNLRRQDERMRRRVAAVEAAEMEVRRLLDELPEAVLLVDVEGVVLSTNAAALGMFDLARREFVDTHLVDQASGEDQARLAAAIQRSFSGVDVEPLQIQMNGARRRKIVVEATFHMRRDADPNWRTLS